MRHAWATLNLQADYKKLMRKKLTMRKLILLFVLTPFLSSGQVLLDLLDNSRHIQVADIYKANNIKRTYYTIEVPFLLYMSISTDHKQDSSSWTKDTITYSKSYLKNGLIENEKQMLPNGDIYSLKEYFFDSIGTLLSTKETNNERLGLYDFLEMKYTYKDGQLIKIDKVRFKNMDTVRTTTVFSYTVNQLNKVLETNINGGDTLLLSVFKYNLKRNYIEESSFIKDFCEVRTIYYYTLDNKGRIVKVAHGLDGFKRKLKPDREISYDYQKELPKDFGLLKIEKYEQ
jgi:hypothetical protein